MEKLTDGVLKLRKLAFGSVMDFGKYLDMTVQQVCDLHHENYLIWCYYNLDRIGFVDDVLNHLYITDDFVINKPGKTPDKRIEAIEHRNKIIYADDTDLDRMKRRSHLDKQRRMHAENTEQLERFKNQRIFQKGISSSMNPANSRKTFTIKNANRK